MNSCPSEISFEICKKCHGEIKAGISLETGGCIVLLPPNCKHRDDCQETTIRKIRHKAGFSGMRGTEKVKH